MENIWTFDYTTSYVVVDGFIEFGKGFLKQSSSVIRQ